jgi:hypothetical protein
MFGRKSVKTKRIKCIIRTASLSVPILLQPLAHFSGDDDFADFSFGIIIFCRNERTFAPLIQSQSKISEALELEVELNCTISNSLPEDPHPIVVRYP